MFNNDVDNKTNEHNNNNHYDNDDNDNNMNNNSNDNEPRRPPVHRGQRLRAHLGPAAAVRHDGHGLHGHVRDPGATILCVCMYLSLSLYIYI